MSARVQVIDSHTAGEPTRMVIAGGPELGGGSVAEKAAVFAKEHDRFRSAVVNEPRGSDILVGAILCESSEPDCAAGVIFFNNVGILGMCGHGMIGVIVTLQHLGRIGPGRHRIETPVGVVIAELAEDGSVSVENVACHRKAKGVALRTIDGGTVHGDVAWGGNWFLLVEDHGLSLALADVERLIAFSWGLRRVANDGGFPEVDHVELFGPSRFPGKASKSFVLCPGKAYDRSPCGTGTSAKLACLAADGKLEEGETWIQESIVGSSFQAKFRWEDRERGVIVPTISGRAHVTAEATLILNDDDPFCWGIRVE